MKKLALLAFALMVLTLTQCKKEEINDTTTTGEEKMVKLTLSIPVDDGSKTDFIDYDNGTIGINWNTPQPDSYDPEKVYETIYLVIPSQYGGIVPMQGRYKNYQESQVLTFEANWHFSISHLDLNNTKFDVWYLGDSGNNGYNVINDPVQYTVSGSINNQTGKLEDLGKYHIAKGHVKFLKVGENEYTLSMAPEDYFESQVAIAKINMNGISQISGNAIVGTEFQLVKSHNDDGIFRITPSKTIDLTETDENSQYLVFFPKTAEEGFSSSLYETIVVEGKNCIKRSYKFANAVEANKVYHVGGGCLPWREAKNDKYYEYVDLGLPSGTIWATKNVEGHYQWGETGEGFEGRGDGADINYRIKIGDEELSEEYDVAQQRWGANWYIPTKAQMEELLANCNREFIENEGVRFTSRNNSKSFVLDYAGVYRSHWIPPGHPGGGENGTGIWTLLGNKIIGAYWSKTSAATENNINDSYLMLFCNETQNSEALEPNISPENRAYAGASIRPVI